MLNLLRLQQKNLSFHLVDVGCNYTAHRGSVSGNFIDSQEQKDKL